MSSPLLLGKRISLISKKNIRYEGILYSINEENATVALQNVISFGTENREGSAFVAPSDAVHPYLVFRGQDIQDLHVHEDTPEPDLKDLPPPPKPAEAKPAAPVPAKKPEPPKEQAPKAPAPKQEQKPKRNDRPQQSNRMVGTGASLLNRTARGANEKIEEKPKADFDFESNLTKFEQENDDDDDDDAGDMPPAAYAKDDFFDSISCEALDKEKGIDNRLRGSTERHLNTETFGAVGLNTNYRRGGRGGRGRGRGGGRGGRGRGRGGRGRGQKPETASS